MILCVIAEYKTFQALALIKDGVIEDLLIKDDKNPYNVGDIVIAKVTDITSNISSAFLDLGGVKAFLPISKDEGIRIGDEIPVIIKQEATGNKDISVSRNLSLPGRYCVAERTGKTPGVRVSVKITDRDERDRLKNCVDTVLTKYDIILRTKAAYADEEDIKAEAMELTAKLDRIYETSVSRTVFSKLYSADDVFSSYIRDCRFGEADRIITELPEVYSGMKSEFPDIQVSLYEDKMLPLVKLHKIESTIESSKDHIVWLKSGAYIVIDRTEAMTVIDVNSGKNSQKRSREETFLNINTEAAREVARQLRIRNISGIIMVDFINMNNKKNYDRLIQALNEALKNDSCGACFIDITKLGIAEITRKKQRRPVTEILNNTE